MCFTHMNSANLFHEDCLIDIAAENMHKEKHSVSFKRGALPLEESLAHKKKLHKQYVC